MDTIILDKDNFDEFIKKINNNHYGDIEVSGYYGTHIVIYDYTLHIELIKIDFDFAYNEYTLESIWFANERKNYYIAGEILDILEPLNSILNPEDILLEDLDLSTRTSNAIRRNLDLKEITVADIICYTADELVRWKWLGKKSLKELKEKLLMYGFNFKED